MAKFSDYEDDVLKEIEKEHEKRGFLAFMTIIFRKFLPLININFLFLVFSLPYILLLFWFSPINATSISQWSGDMAGLLAAMPVKSAFLVDIMLRFMFAMLVCVLWGTGPASAGISYILRNYSRGEFAWVWADFIGTIKENIKQSLIVLAVDIAAIFVFSTLINFYTNVMTGPMSVVSMVLIGIFLLLYTFMHFYIYQLMVSFEDTTKQLYKNALLFAMIKWMPNLLMLIFVAAAIVALFYYTQLYALLFFAVILTIILALVIHFNASRIIARFIQAQNTQNK